ncbi:MULTISPECIES: ABC transporter substrate-binding protein [unclassified Leucobacter]|uniref:ABC transporter substrate-binding protein n=1 Tax=unclassified Leucobacter TaxID=2621730 RepID=UPI00165DA7DF|nr:MULTISPECIES: ABC transporter substrate-binding protein [unclassified Leucobacter]MBC9927777.1 ABC transporter substrate-binding protein [Leucobacter sp. cx-169]
MQDRLAIEQVVDRSTPLESLPREVPAQLWEYTQAFLRVERRTVRFMWRDGDRWLDVTLVRGETTGGARALPRVSVRINEAEMPRGITAREFDVLTLVALGLTNGGIAERLGTSARTVSTQIERLLGKLGQGTRGGLAALAVDVGLLRLPLPGGAPEAGGIGVAELELAHRSNASHGLSPIRANEADRAPILLGIVIPKDVGGDTEQMLHGALLAVDEVNEQGGLGGRQIKVVQAPVEMFGWESVRAGLQSLFDAGVDAIVTSYVSAEHPGFLELIADYGRPFLHTATFDADVLRTEAEPYRYGAIFQTCASEVHYAPGMLRFVQALEASGKWTPRTHRVVGIEQASISMRLSTPAFIETANACGWDVARTIETPAGATDWEQVIAEANAVEPDVLFVANYLEDELVAFQQALLRDPIPALVYSVYAPSIPSFAERLGAQAEGIVWSTTTGTYDDDLGRRFRRRYRERFGADPGWSQAGAAYDQVRVLAAAWSSVDARNVTEVTRYIRRWPHRGVNGVYYFGESGHAPLLYPDTTNDAALSQAHLVYQMRGREQVLLAPEPFGKLSDFRLPPWISTV